MPPNYLILTIENSYWILKNDTVTYRLNPISVRLDAVVEAVRELYPTLQIEIDPDISKNIWFGKHLIEAVIEGSFDLAALTGEFQFQESRICSRCKEEAYYNGKYNKWVCTDCLAHESFIDKYRYFRRTRRNEFVRREEYFGK